MLRQLLLDADETQVTVETAEALLNRWDLVGIREVASALVLSDEELTTSWLVEAVNGVFMQTQEDLTRAMALTQRLREDEDPEARAGAERLLRLLDTGE